jgi:hypothetical protein
MPERLAHASSSPHALLLPVLPQQMHAGVPISVVQLRYSLADTAAAPLVAYCRDKGITVLATEALLSGLLSEAWLGCAAPGAGAGAAAGGALVEGGEPLAAGLDAVRRWVGVCRGGEGCCVGVTCIEGCQGVLWAGWDGGGAWQGLQVRLHTGCVYAVH